MNRAVVLGLAAVLAASPGFAQSLIQPDETLPGFRPQNVLEARGIDNVNPFNGDVGIVLPLGPEYTLSAFSKWQLKAFYSAKLWRMDSGRCYQYPLARHAYLRGDPTIGVGWTLNLGYVGASGYFSADGGFHQVNFGVGNQGTTDDGTQLRITALPTQYTATSYTVEFPDGSKHTFAQSFSPPHPILGTSPDFTEDGWVPPPGGPPAPRFGLTKIEDSAGNQVLTVSYDTAFPWQMATITLPTLGQSISVHRTAFFASGSIAWLVVDYIDFPVFGSTTKRRVTFSYQPATFVRNEYDNSFAFLCGGVSPSNVAVPALSSITFSDTAGSFSYDYTMAYYTAPAPSDTTPIQQQGALQTITFPTGGYVTYAYSQTSRGACEVPFCDPEALRAEQPARDSASPISDEWQSFMDKSIAIISRCEGTDAVPCPSAATTTYTRATFVVRCNPFCDGEYFWDPLKIVRRVDVVAPGNDSGGMSQYLTRHYFHVAGFIDGIRNLRDGGIELERQSYGGASTFTGMVRDTVSCWTDVVYGTASCGYHTSAGTATFQAYGLGTLPPKAGEVTWYGAVLSGDGGTCTPGSTPCQAWAHGPAASDYDSVAMQYRTTTYSNANLPIPSPSRTSFINWAAVVDSSHWLLDVYDERNETESSTTIYRGFQFDSTGFARGQWTSDQPFSPTNRSLLLDCRYPDTVGQPKWQFSATYPAATLNALGLTNPPFHNVCSQYYGSYPGGSIGANSDAFGHVFSWTHGLLNSDAWVKGGGDDSPTTLPWFGFNVTRDTASGLIATSRDVSGTPTGFGYDALARLTCITPGGGTCASPQTSEIPTAITYDSPTQTTISRNGGTGLTTWQRYLYDGFGRLNREIRLIPTPSGSYAVRMHAYDSAGHQSFDSEWASCVDATGDCLAAMPRGTQRSNFDPFGRPQTVARADGSTTSISYSDGPILVSDTSKAVTVSNINGSCSGNCSGGTSATTTYGYDVYGRLVQVKEPSGDLTSYTYDVNGKLTGVTQGTQMRSFLYDTYGFLRSESTPEKGTVDSTGTVGGGLKIGSLGNVRERTEAYGTAHPKTHDYTYDSAGRLSTETVNGVQYLMNCYDGSAATPLCPDGTSNFAGGSKSLGKLTRRNGSNPFVAPYPSVDDNFTYSGLNGRLSTLSTTVAGGIGQVDQSWIYNNLGLAAQHYHARPAGGSPLVVSTVYSAGLPTALYANGLPVAMGIDYAASGTPQHYTTGLFAGKTVTTTIGPDTTLMPRPASIATSGASSISLGSYSYDGVGNIMAIGADTFHYDDRSRLTLGTLSGYGSQSYSYDRFGNMLDKGAVTFCSLTCTNNQLPAPSWLYDERGNLTNSPSENYLYDDTNRTVGTSSGWYYVYNGSGERVVRISPVGSSTYTFRDEANRFSTEFSGATPSLDNVFLGSQVVASYANGAVGGNDHVWAFYTSDHLGTPRLVTDVSGSLFDTRKYWPFGEQLASGSSLQFLRFATMERDTEAGPNNDRYFDHARYHGAALGRFLTPDLLQGRVAVPRTWNRYTYAGNNPIGKLDRNGLQDAPATEPLPSQYGAPGPGVYQARADIAHTVEAGGSIQAAAGPFTLSIQLFKFGDVRVSGHEIPILKIGPVSVAITTDKKLQFKLGKAVQITHTPVQVTGDATVTVDMAKVPGAVNNEVNAGIAGIREGSPGHLAAEETVIDRATFDDDKVSNPGQPCSTNSGSSVCPSFNRQR